MLFRLAYEQWITEIRRLDVADINRMVKYASRTLSWPFILSVFISEAQQLNRTLTAIKRENLSSELSHIYDLRWDEIYMNQSNHFYQ